MLAEPPYPAPLRIVQPGAVSSLREKTPTGVEKAGLRCRVQEGKWQSAVPYAVIRWSAYGTGRR